MRHSRLAHHLTRGPTGLFHFRLIVPADLRAVVGRSVIKQSLGTRAPSVAIVWAQALAVGYASAFAAHRGRVVPKPPPIEDILRAVREGRSKDYTIQGSPGGGFSITANGAEDHAMALEAIGKIPDSWRQAAAAPTAVAAPAPNQRIPITLADAIRKYEETDGPGLIANTSDGRKRSCKSFVEKFGAKTDATSITRPMAAEWGGDLIRNGASRETARNYVSHVAQIYDFLKRTGFTDENPVKGVIVIKKKEKRARLAAGHTWEPFDTYQLGQIYKPENLVRARTAHVRWAALIGLYTGARVGEVAQLYLRDFIQADGVHCIHITSQSDGQTLKTVSSERLVPIHRDLVRLGLLDRVNALRKKGEERLFPEVKLDGKAGPGNAVSKGFAYYLGLIDIRPRNKNGRVGFHSLRKTVIQELQGAHLSDDRRRALTGHEGADDVHTAHYMRPWRPDELASFLSGLKWAKWLDFDALKPLLASE